MPFALVPDKNAYNRSSGNFTVRPLGKKLEFSVASSAVNKQYVDGHFTCISNNPTEGSDGSTTIPSGEAPSHGNDGLTTNPQSVTVKSVLEM